jgi:hypothetical protein
MAQALGMGQGDKKMNQVFRAKSVLTSELYTLLYGKMTN